MGNTSAHPTGCVPSLPDRTPTGEPLVAQRLVGSEHAHLGTTNLDRACRLWLNLAGTSWDFDDLQEALALRLGWTDPGALGLGEFLEATASVIDAASWRVVRRHALEVFFDLAQPMCRECPEVDPRSFDELCDDTQFDRDGRCRLCALGDTGPPDLHRDVAAALVSGRLHWDEVVAAVDPGGSGFSPAP